MAQEPHVAGAGTVLFDIADELAQQGLDACTLNNALNIAQLVVLVSLLRWVRGNDER